MFWLNGRKSFISTETNQSYQSISQESKDYEQKCRKKQCSTVFTDFGLLQHRRKIYPQWPTHQCASDRIYQRKRQIPMKGQRYKADYKYHLEEIKCLVRRKLYGAYRHHQKTETDRAWAVHQCKIGNGKGVKRADSCRGKTAQNPQQGKGGYGDMRLSRYEQETIVNYNAGEQTATLYTRDRAVMRKLDTLVADFPETYKLTG